MRGLMFANLPEERTISTMSVGLWVAIGVTAYLMLAALGVLLCRGIAMADEAEAHRAVRSGGGPSRWPSVPPPRSGVTVGSRPAVR